MRELEVRVDSFQFLVRVFQRGGGAKERNQNRLKLRFRGGERENKSRRDDIERGALDERSIIAGFQRGRKRARRHSTLTH